MSRKSGKPPRKNPFLQKDRDQLLNELSSIQDMLGDAGEDVDETGIPTLTDEGQTGAQGGKDADGDARNQIPLLAPDDDGASGQSPNEANERLRRALKERENPFLSGAARAADSQKPQHKAESAPQPAPEAAPEPPAEPAPPEAARLDEQQMRALVDEVLAAWLPKIERELRARLMEYLRGQ